MENNETPVTPLTREEELTEKFYNFFDDIAAMMSPELLEATIMCLNKDRNAINRFFRDEHGWRYDDRD